MCVLTRGGRRRQVAVADGGGHGDGEEEGVDETPIDVLTLVARVVQQVVVLRLEDLGDHVADVLLGDVRMVQAFDMFYIGREHRMFKFEHRERKKKEERKQDRQNKLNLANNKRFRHRSILPEKS